MHFEGPIWKYLKAYPLGPWEKKNGATCIFLPDPFYIKFFLEIKPENGIRFLRPENVTLEFFINEFENPGLFPCEETLVITEAQDLTSEAKEILLQKNWDFSTKGLILFFNKKVSQWQKALSNYQGEKFHVTTPKFWEFSNMLDFLCHWFGINISISAKEYLEQSIEFEVYNLYQCLNFLKICYSDQVTEIQLSQVKEVVNQKRLDFFELAKLVSQKKFSVLAKKIVQVETDFDDLRKLFSSLQGHLIKLGDSSYTSKKAKLAKYDQEILTSSKLWTREEIAHALELFSRWEILAKEKDEFLIHRLKQLSS